MRLKNLVRAVVAFAALTVLAACGQGPVYQTYPGVTQVIVNKSERRMFLMHGDTPLRIYPIDLGFAPEGDKQVEGDGRTPEGDYIIDRRNPNSKFYLSLGIDYPRPHDIAEARALGKPAGGDIFIHGEADNLSKDIRDWTAGCIAMSNEQMLEFYSFVRVGTPIRINP